MMDFEEIAKQRIIKVFNEEIAECLVNEHGLQSLIDIEQSLKHKGKRVYTFYNFPSLFEDFQAMVQDVREQNEKRRDFKNEGDK